MPVRGIDQSAWHLGGVSAGREGRHVGSPTRHVPFEVATAATGRSMLEHGPEVMFGAC